MDVNEVLMLLRYGRRSAADWGAASDLLEEAGRLTEAELLRSGRPVILEQTLAWDARAVERVYRWHVRKMTPIEAFAGKGVGPWSR